MASALGGGGRGERRDTLWPWSPRRSALETPTLALGTLEAACGPVVGATLIVTFRDGGAQGFGAGEQRATRNKEILAEQVPTVLRTPEARVPRAS